MLTGEDVPKIFRRTNRLDVMQFVFGNDCWILEPPDWRLC